MPNPLRFILTILFAAVCCSTSAQDYKITWNRTSKPSKVWEVYQKNKTDIDARLAGDVKDQEVLELGFGVAQAAIMIESVDTLDHIDRALGLIDRIPQNNSLSAFSKTAALGLVDPLLNRGFVEIAGEVVERVQKIPIYSRIPPQAAALLGAMIGDMGDSAIAGYINDYETLERIAIGRIKRSEERRSKPPKTGPRAHSDASGKRTQWLEIAKLQAKQGKSVEAKSSYDRAMGRAIPTIADSDITTISVKAFRATADSKRLYNNLIAGETLFLLKEYTEAESHLIEALSLIGQPALHKITPGSGTVIYQTLRGQVLFELGRSTEALEGWQIALDAVSKPNGDTGMTLPDHSPYVAAVREGRAWALLQSDDPDAATEALRIHETHLEMTRRLFEFASERQRLAYLQSSDPFSLLIATNEIEILAEAVIKLKGAVLDSVLEDRRAAQTNTTPEHLETRRQAKFAQNLVLNASWHGAGNLPEKQANLKALETALAKHQPAGNTQIKTLNANLGEVMKALGPEDKLCEFIRYRRPREEGGTEPFYGALVITGEEAPKWFPLAPASLVDPLIFELKNAMSGAGADDAILSEKLKGLYTALISPMEEKISGGSRLIIAPDGPLSCLSFAVLLDANDKFLSEKWELYYVSTARDLLKPGSPPPAQLSVLMFADPDFSMAIKPGSSTGVIRGTSIPFSLDISALPPLPGTRDEMDSIASIAAEHDWTFSSFSGQQASEESLREMKTSADILHFATHGLFLEKDDAVAATSDQSISSRQEQGRVDDPLKRSMLTLAGADSTLQSWRNKQAPAPSNDGILSAAEVSTLDLNGTWMAILSACDTAAGDQFDGEGVMGLRRGFFLAGVDHLLMTFWPIADEETVAIISEFYDDLAESRHPGQSIAKVQREALVKLRDERSLQEAVFLAGPFAVSVSGKIPSTH